MISALESLRGLGFWQWIFPAVILLLFLPNIVRFIRADAVVAFDQDDPEFLNAIAQARETLHQFWSRLGQQKDDLRLFAIKVALFSEQGREHVWLAVRPDASVTKKGILVNRPRHLKLWEGDEVSFCDDDITDWMIRGEADVLGCYSIRAMMRKLPDSKAREVAAQHQLPYEEVMAGR